MHTMNSLTSKHCQELQEKEIEIEMLKKKVSRLEESNTLLWRIIQADEKIEALMKRARELQVSFLSVVR